MDPEGRQWQWETKGGTDVRDTVKEDSVGPNS